jgi:hypothetical protein
VTANAEGSVEFVRELGSASDAGKKFLPLLRAISFPKIEADGRALGTVVLVKVARTPDGKVLVARSVLQAWWP